VVDRAVARHLPQPGQETLRVAQLADALPGAEEGFLGNVFAGAHVARHRQRHAGHHALGGAHEAAIGLGVAALGGGQVAGDQAVQQVGAHGGARVGITRNNEWGPEM
jgi:hypothetical protein